MRIDSQKQMGKFDKYTNGIMAACATMLLIAGVIMFITEQSDSGTFVTRSGEISGGTVNGPGLIVMAIVIGVFALMSGDKPKKKKKKKKK